MRWFALAMGTALLFAALGALGWAYLLYPDEDDPKSLRYVLWKHDLVSIDLDRAAYVIADDPDGKRDLVIGQTKAQLHARFGFLLTPHEAGPTLERCIQGSWADKKDALHLRHSDMIVVFENGIATDASVLKPC